MIEGRTIQIPRWSSEDVRKLLTKVDDSIPYPWHRHYVSTRETGLLRGYHSIITEGEGGVILAGVKGADVLMALLFESAEDAIEYKKSGFLQVDIYLAEVQKTEKFHERDKCTDALLEHRRGLRWGGRGWMVYLTVHDFGWVVKSDLAPRIAP